MKKFVNHSTTFKSIYSKQNAVPNAICEYYSMKNTPYRNRKSNN